MPDWGCLAHRIHPLALPARRGIAPGGRYACPAPVQRNLEEGQFVASATEICGSSRSGKNHLAKLNSATPPLRMLLQFDVDSPKRLQDDFRAARTISVGSGFFDDVRDFGRMRQHRDMARWQYR